MSLGAAGGPTIITQVAQAILWSVDQDLSPKMALSPARIHHQWLPDRLLVESKLDKPVQEELQSLGHQVELRGGLGAAQLVRWNEKLKSFQASADPRGNGKALGW
jgi:gamma-glutamyltranspeptidase/glutathione hydrolase